MILAPLGPSAESNEWVCDLKQRATQTHSMFIEKMHDLFCHERTPPVTRIGYCDFIIHRGQISRGIIAQEHGSLAIYLELPHSAIEESKDTKRELLQCVEDVMGHETGHYLHFLKDPAAISKGEESKERYILNEIIAETANIHYCSRAHKLKRYVEAYRPFDDVRLGVCYDLFKKGEKFFSSLMAKGEEQIKILEPYIKSILQNQ